MFTRVFAGAHCNRAWTIHSTFSEALERLLMSRFIWERNINFSNEIKDYLAEGNCDIFDNSMVDMLSPLSIQYESYKEKSMERQQPVKHLSTG